VVSPTLFDGLEVTDPSPQKRRVTRHPMDVAVDLPTMFPAPTDNGLQNFLFDYFNGRLTNLSAHDWSPWLSLAEDPADRESHCVSGPKPETDEPRYMNAQQATVWNIMRSWQRTIAESRGDPKAAPKGFLAWHQVGSGKTCLIAATILAFLNADNPAKGGGEKRPIYIVTSTENQKNLLQKDSRGISRLEACMRDLMPDIAEVAFAQSNGKFSYSNINHRF